MDWWTKLIEFCPGVKCVLKNFAKGGHNMDIFLAVLNLHTFTEAPNKKLLTVCDDAFEVVGKRPVNRHSDDGVVVSTSILVSPS